jgi:PAS domain S-box-containing protein
MEGARVSHVLAGQTFREGGYASLLDGTGRIIARSANADQFVGHTVRNWVTDGVSAGGFGILRGHNLSGIEIITAFRRVSGTPGWSLTVAEPLSTSDASLWIPLATLALGGLGALGIALAAAIWIGSRVLRPVDWLTQKAERVAVTGGAADIVPIGPRVRVREFERLRVAVLQAHMVLRERAWAVAAGEARLRAVVDTAADAIVVANKSGTILSFNRAAEAIFGYPAPDAVGENVSMLISADHAAQRGVCLIAHLQTGEQIANGTAHEIEGRRQDGATVPLDLSIAEWQDAAASNSSPSSCATSRCARRPRRVRTFWSARWITGRRISWPWCSRCCV